MNDITVIILIGRERMYLKRCVEKLVPLKLRQILLVELQPDDGAWRLRRKRRRNRMRLGTLNCELCENMYGGML